MGLIENNLLPIASVVLSLSALIIAWALLWDRALGRLRCRKCRYRMEGTPPTADGSITCPECGRMHRHERRLRYTRRRYKTAMLALLVALTSWYAIDYHWRFRERGWWGYVPTTVLILHPISHSTLLDRCERTWVQSEPSSDVVYSDPPFEREISYRLGEAWTWDWQFTCWRWFVKRRFEAGRRASSEAWADEVICRTYDLSDLTTTRRVVFPRGIRGTRMYCWSPRPDEGARLRDSDIGDWTANLTEPVEWLVSRTQSSSGTRSPATAELEVGDTFTLVCDEAHHQLFAAILASIRQPMAWELGGRMPDEASVLEQARVFGDTELVVIAFDIRPFLGRGKERGLIDDDPDSVWEFLGDYFDLFDLDLYDDEINLWSFTTPDATRILAAGEPAAVVKLVGLLQRCAEPALAPSEPED